MILDLLENFTSIHYNGCSVADYTLVSSNLLNSIRHIKVHELSSLLDHFPIMRSIIAAISNTRFTENIKLDPLPGNNYGMQIPLMHIQKTLVVQMFANVFRTLKLKNLTTPTLQLLHLMNSY